MVYKLPDTRNISPIEPRCRKKIYNSEEEAREMIRYIRENRRVREMRAYKCDVCGFWHLTSKTE
jgi:hypothetical protein